eukprot:1482097-Alexandrium_andersonii.AAC.1
MARGVRPLGSWCLVAQHQAVGSSLSTAPQSSLEGVAHRCAGQGPLLKEKTRDMFRPGIRLPRSR